ncbi:uncharacterized protein LOC135486550 isoform X2 [Lineus longissimus]|uniref:uncharacterized protein LOC135486550 isoform X2 n=1 Tax=Lineus longissimus TaxID=88925 RepID=UPI002B4C67EA
MKLELEVLASTSIKRKKPWPSFAWLGEENESLFMMDTHRLSVLYLPSGKTKKKIPKLRNVLQEAVSLTHTKNGHYLVGLLQCGDLFLWYKDKDMLKMIHGMANLMMTAKPSGGARGQGTRGTHKPKVLMSEDGANILVVMGLSRVFLWQIDPGQNMFASKKGDVKGRWSLVAMPDDVQMPIPEYKEASVSGSFMENKVLGQLCMVSFVFNVEQSLVVTTLTVMKTDGQCALVQSGPGYAATWTSIQYPLASITPNCQSVRSRGSYLCCYANQNPILAVAVNQKRPSDTRMLFVSPLNDTIVVSDLKGCGQKDVKKYGRSYWLADLKWTSDDLFVACISKNGSLCILTRLGEPVHIQTHGCSVELGPAPYLPLHPLITVRSQENVHPDDPNSPHLSSMVSELDLMKQRYSLAVHPRFPIILCSDGYLVSVISFPDHIHSLRVIKELVVDANNFLGKIRQRKNIDISLIDTLKFSDIPGEDGPNTPQQEAVAKHLPFFGSTLSLQQSTKSFRFEDYEDRLNDTVDSDGGETSGFGHAGQFGVMDANAGKIVFGDSDLSMSKCMMPRDDEETDENLMIWTYNSLCAAWGISVSSTEIWTVEMEILTSYVVHLMVKMFKIILHQTTYGISADSLRGERQALFPQGVNTVLNIYRTLLSMCHFDAVQQNVLPMMMRFLYGTMDVLLKTRDPNNETVRTDVLNACAALLTYMEKDYNQIYALSPRGKDSGLTARRFPVPRQDQYEPQVLSHDDCNMTLKRIVGKAGMRILSKRFGKPWYRLYRHVTKYYRTLQMIDAADDVMMSARRLLCRTERKLHQLKYNIPTPVSWKPNRGDDLYLDGYWNLAVQMWKEKITEYPVSKLQSKKASRLLHAILYTSIQSGDLQFALDMADTLLHSIPDNQDPKLWDDSERAFLSMFFEVPGEQEGSLFLPSTEYGGARELVQTMGRFMAAYFSNHSLYVHPPHAPKKLPPLYSDIPITDRIIPVYHESIAAVVRQDGLGNAWSMDRTMEYLLMSGLLPEAVWFANKMGDWKSAFLLAVACVDHQRIAEEKNLKPKKSLNLPSNLTPQAILQSKLEALLQVEKPEVSRNGTNNIGARLLKRRASVGSLPDEDHTNIEQMTKSIREILTAATISQADTTSWLLQGLVGKLKELVKTFPALVPQGFYLPAPPLYCPQPTTTFQEHSTSDVENEQGLRMQVASVVQLILLVLNASDTTLPAVRWYIHQLDKIQSKGEPFRNLATSSVKDLDELLGTFGDNSILEPHLTNPAIQNVLSAFRDLCTVLWFVHSRDKMSTSLRKKAAVLKSTDYLEGSEQGLEEDQWLRNCYSTLQWSIQMIPFTRFINSEAEVYETVLSQLIEFPANQESADIMVEYFHDEDSLDGVVQEKFVRIRKEWQRIFLGEKEESSETSSSQVSTDDKLARLSKQPVKARRGKTLSSYFHQQCQRIPKLYKSRAKAFGHIEPFVFDPKNRPLKADILHIGSRPFEIEGLYLHFLDTMFTVAFSKLQDEEHHHREKPAQPLLPPFSEEICNAELSSLSYRIMTSLQQNKNLSLYSPKTSPHTGEKVTGTPPPSPRRSLLKESPMSTPSSPRTPRPRLLMRSHSYSELRPAGEKPPPVMPILKKKSASQTSLDKIGQEKKIQRSVSFSQEDNTYFGHYRLQRSSSVANVRVSQEAEDTSPRINLKTKRSLSLSDLRPKIPSAPEASQAGAPALPMSEFLGFHDDLRELYPHLAQLLDWLMRWSSKHHNLSALGVTLEGGVAVTGAPQPAMRVRLQPFMVLLGIWLIDYKYEVNGKPKWEPRVDKVQREPFPHELELELGSLDAAVEKIQQARVIDTSPEKRDKGFQSKEKKNSPVDYVPTEVGVDVVEKAEKAVDVAATPPRPKPRSTQFVKKLTFSGAELPHNRVSQIRSSNKMNERPPIERASSEDLLSSTLNISTLTIDDQLTGVSRDNFTESLLSDDLNPDAIEEDEIKASEAVSAETGVNPDHVDPSAGPAPTANMQDLGQHLSGVIRSELRRIVEIQHRSVLAMLGAVDGDGTNMAALQPAAYGNPEYGASNNRYNPLIPQTAATQTTLTLKEAGHASAGTNTPVKEKRHYQNDADLVYDATDFDVSTGSLVTETADSENAQQDKAHRSSNSAQGKKKVRSTGTNPESSGSRESERRVAFDMPDDKTRLRRAKRRQRQDPPVIPSALHELNFLSVNTSPILNNPHPSHQGANGGPLQDTESRMPLLQLDNNQQHHNPFMSSAQSARNPEPIKLPNIPFQSKHAWGEDSQIRGSGTYENIPNFVNRYNVPTRNEAPVKDDLNPFGMPLLHIEYDRVPVLVAPPFEPMNQVAHQMQDDLLKEFQAWREYERFGHNLLHIDFNRLSDEEKRAQAEKNEAKRRERRIRKASQSDSEENNQKGTRPKQVNAATTPRSPTKVKHPVSTQVTPRGAADQEVQYSGSTGTDEGEQKLHDGYALSKGIFDEYLYLDKSGADDEETSAKVQYDVFVKGKGKHVDFATNTTPRPGTPDPVKQAIMSYIKEKAGEGTNILAPDIIFGLRYGQSQPSSGAAPSVKSGDSPGRSYINVVEIDRGYADDIVSSMPDKKGGKTQQERRSLSPVVPRPPWETKAERRGVSPDRPSVDELSSRKLGPDRTTVKMFEETPAEAEAKKFASKILSGRVARSKSKQAVMRKLQEMNIQLNAVDQIAQNVDDEFNDAKMLMNTIENLAGSMQPLYPQSKAAYGDEESSPDSINKPMRSESPDRRSPQDRPLSEADQLRISGLSGVSDIIGEYVAKGEIDYRAAGLSAKDAEKISKRARFTPREEWENVHLSQEKLQEIFSSRRFPPVSKDAEEKKKLHEWMAKKRVERLQEYKDKRQRLKEEEVSPFKPTGDSVDLGTGTFKEIKDVQGKKETVRKLMEHEHMTKRMEMAHDLMADIVHDKPKLPKEPEPKPASVPKPAVQQEKKPSKSILRKVNDHGARVGDYRAGVDYDSDWLGFSGDQFRNGVAASHEYRDMARPEVTHQFVHHFDQDDAYSELETSRNLANYTRQIEHMDEMDEHEKDMQVERETPFKAYKPKPFTQVVKMQRPEVTRQKQRGKPVSYQDQLASMNKTTTIKTHTPMDLKEKERLYGTKRVPGHYPTYKPSATRHVKTYAERLQEMKTPSTGYPLTPKSGKKLPADYMAQITRRGIHTDTTQPRRVKEQPRPETRPKESHTPRMVVSRIRTKALAHQPKTYGEQLREINANAPRFRRSKDAYTPRQTNVYRSPPLKSMVRRRPYHDPYTSMERAELQSVLSDYRMEDDVKRLLYDNDDDSLALGAEAIMSPGDDRSYTDLPYTSLVDVQQLADAISVSEGSIMSVIDWDAVDQLIADVR